MGVVSLCCVEWVLMDVFFLSLVMKKIEITIGDFPFCDVFSL